MSFVSVSAAQQVTAVRLLKEAGIAVERIADNSIFFADSPTAVPSQVLRNLSKIAAEDNLKASRLSGYQVVCKAIIGAAATFTADLPQETVSSWPAKAAAARAYFPGATSAILEAEAEIAGVDIEELVVRIIAKAEVYETAIARLDGLRSAAWAGIEAASSSSDVDATVSDMLSLLRAIVPDYVSG